MRSFCWSESPISLNARVSSPTSSREVGETRTESFPAASCSTPSAKPAQWADEQSDEEGYPLTRRSSTTAMAAAASCSVLLRTTGSTNTVRSNSTCASPTQHAAIQDRVRRPTAAIRSLV